MKKLLLLCAISVLMFAFGGSLFAQEEEGYRLGELTADENNGGYFEWKETPWTLGGSFEVGMNSRENAATGISISLERYFFTSFIALGIRGTMHNDGLTITANELIFNLRIYTPPLVDKAALYTAFFAQWGFGGSFYREEEREKNTYTMNILAGCRIYFTQNLVKVPLRGFYVEPYIRTGFPFVFSGGIAAGHWFNF